MVHFWRCRDCLAVVTTDTAHGMLQCACEGLMDYLGVPRGTRLIRPEMRTPCDQRCTGAIGPHCDCQCLGENHGSRRLVRVIVDAGKVPRISEGADLQAAAEFRAARDAASARIDALPGMEEYRRGKWIDRPLFLAIVAARKSYRAAIGLKTHKLRMERLASVAQEG